MSVKITDALMMMKNTVANYSIVEDMNYCFEHSDKTSAMVILRNEKADVFANLLQVAKDLLLAWAIDCECPVAVKKALLIGADPQAKFFGDICTSLFPVGGFTQKGERAVIRAMRKGNQEVICALLT